jgi:hypothetical protein
MSPVWAVLDREESLAGRKANSRRGLTAPQRVKIVRLGLPVPNRIFMQPSSERCDPSYWPAQLERTPWLWCVPDYRCTEAGATWRCIQLHTAATYQRSYRARYATPSLFKQLKAWSTAAKEQKAECKRSGCSQACVPCRRTVRRRRRLPPQSPARVTEDGAECCLLARSKHSSDDCIVYRRQLGLKI